MPIRNPTSEQLSLHCVLTHDPDHISDGVWVHRQAHREHKEQDGKSRQLWPRPEQAREYLGERINVSLCKMTRVILVPRVWALSAPLCSSLLPFTSSYC